MGAKFNIFTKK